MRTAIELKRGLFALLLVILPAAPAFSGPLNGDGLALVSGTTPFNNFQGLSGTVDYAVYTYTNFLLAWPASGYAPTLNEIVYTYQVYVIDDNPLDNLDLLGLSQLSVFVTNPADNPGWFTIGGGSAPSATGLGIAATWDFDPETYVTAGLAYSSPRLPTWLGGNVIDGGTNALVDPLPSPGLLIPEPATISLFLAAALCGMPSLIGWMRKKR